MDKYFPLEQNVHIWRQILFANKKKRNGEKLRSFVFKYCNGFLQKSYTNFQHFKQTSPSYVDLPMTHVGGLTRPGNHTRQPIHKKGLHRLYRQPKLQLFACMGSTNPQSNCQLPVPLDLHLQPISYHLQVLSEGH